MKTNDLVLASSSAYRQALLKKLHLNFVSIHPDIDETVKKDEPLTQLALRLAQEKAMAVAASHPKHLIIGSDQVAIVDNTQLKKPGNQSNAIKQLQLCSGKAVKFYTSVCILNSATSELKTAINLCTVYFKKLNEQQIKNYIALEQPYDCAGSFKAESLGITLFKRIEGDDPNALTGLPLIALTTLLNEFGIDVLSNN